MLFISYRFGRGVEFTLRYEPPGNEIPQWVYFVHFRAAQVILLRFFIVNPPPMSPLLPIMMSIFVIFSVYGVHFLSFFNVFPSGMIIEAGDVAKMMREIHSKQVKCFSSEEYPAIISTFTEIRLCKEAKFEVWTLDSEIWISPLQWILLP